MSRGSVGFSVAGNSHRSQGDLHAPPMSPLGLRPRLATGIVSPGLPA